jgi:sporulation protein YlmC with PRC-barrel domain
MTEANAPRAEVLRTRDLVGWDVTDREGAKIGDLADLLFGRDGKIRYVSVNLGLFRKHVLVPAEVLEWSSGALVVSPWTAAEVKALPGYDGEPLTAAVLEEMERAHPRFYGDAPAVSDSGEHRIVPLSEARDFRLSRGAPDPRGWTVFAGDNERVGVVKDMLVDPVAMKIRFISVDLADDLFNLREDRHVLVPMETVELRERGEDAWIMGASAREVAALPAFTGGAVDRWMERAVLHAFGLAAPDYDDLAVASPPRTSAPDTPPPPPEPTTGP